MRIRKEWDFHRMLEGKGKMRHLQYEEGFKRMALR
jgi:hypothetical protein